MSDASNSNNAIDLRSDTVTKPTAAMREAMAKADVGDDVYGDDPTVRLLEQEVTSLLGKEAAVFVASGTQSNLIAMLSHCNRGEEYISGVCNHVARYEAAGAAVLGGIAPFQLNVDERGAITLDELKEAIKPDDPHFPISRLLCLENTVYGRLQDQDNIENLAAFAKSEGLSVHMDGARLMNAAVRSNRSAKELVDCCDTVSLCLSKGLGSPVGSVLAGDEEFIQKARRNRKLLGGGMRQVGILAAAGLYALEHHVDRLAEDHRRAHDLANILSQYDEITVHEDRLDTNMVFISITEEHRDPLYNFLKEQGVILGSPAEIMRCVTHLDVDDAALTHVKLTIDRYFDIA
ncbi:MAG: low-specificity L-threonine aldolase [Hyphomicrobiales bacterium]